MKNILKYTLPSLVLFGVLAVGIIAVQAYGPDGQYPPIVEKLAERFNLDVEEVKDFFDQDRAQMQAQMQADFEQRLEESDLTEEQKSFILEAKQRMEEIREIDDLDQRHEEMQALRDEIKEWAEENDIEPGFIMGMGRKGPGRGFGKMGGCPE